MAVSWLSEPPRNLETAHTTLLNVEAQLFLADLIHDFHDRVTDLHQKRRKSQLCLDEESSLPSFDPMSSDIRDSAWEVDPTPPRLQNRHIDLGDVSPSNTSHLLQSLNSKAQGIQVDFDDGHCPSWSNQLSGLYNVYKIVRGEMIGAPCITDAPILMLRPRAWNMLEFHMMVDGVAVPGSLFDFGLLMFHNARILYDSGSGPYFYLSKLENASEAQLWNDIFAWTERRLHLPERCVKACVLIENVLACFQLHEILYALRHRSIGLNCGMWDYSASFVNKFGSRKAFVLPDRKKYVSMERHFLKSYLNLVISVCHQRGCHATGGMTAALLPNRDREYAAHEEIKRSVCAAKQKEIDAGVDGFLVYDIALLPAMLQLFATHAPTANQIHVKRTGVSVSSSDLLQMPSGGVTLPGLQHNIAVAVLFIESWLREQGHFFYKGAVEDSATAEISRSQVWQWIRHQSCLEGTEEHITLTAVRSLVDQFIQDMFLTARFSLVESRTRLLTAARIFLLVVSMKTFPEFITTFLNETYIWQKNQTFLRLTSSL